MEIRHTKPADMDAVLALYDAARCFMAENGNPDQWVNGYPGADQLSLDMASGGSYVCVDGSAIVGTFYFALGDEPNYHRIDGGSWLNEPALWRCPSHHFSTRNPGSCLFLLGMVLCSMR